jgi:hypothetical protein
LNKKLKKKTKKKSYWYWYMYSNPIKDAFIMSNIRQYIDMSTNRHIYKEIWWVIQHLQKNKLVNL